MQTFYFYDLETSGFSPREARIMQFAGQRTDMQLRPIGDPHNFLIKLTDDVLPDPGAVLVTGITPQKTISDGITEAAFLKFFTQEVATRDTIFVGYNTVRFDDEFMRFLFYRNFYDAYEWQWQDGRSRWDLLDVVRMTRALRPNGIKWPFASDGKPTNRLELLTAVNGISHTEAHDALSDVRAVIDLARLLKAKQPKLFDYLLTMRDKSSVISLVESGAPFVYTSGKYNSEWEKTTVVVLLTKTPDNAYLVYDLRHDPKDYDSLDENELVAAWKRRWDEEGLHLPVKTLKPNRCPAVAPLSVLDDNSQTRLGLELSTINKHLVTLKSSTLSSSVLKALTRLEKSRQESLIVDLADVDNRLYDGFVSSQDKQVMTAVRKADPKKITEFTAKLKDERLRSLLPLYKARNYPSALTDAEKQQWDKFRYRKLLGGKNESRLSEYFARLKELGQLPTLTDEQQFLLEELLLYGQSVMPTDA